MIFEHCVFKWMKSCILSKQEKIKKKSEGKHIEPEPGEDTEESEEDEDEDSEESKEEGKGGGKHVL